MQPQPLQPLGRAHLQSLQNTVGPAVKHHECVVLTARNDVPVIRQQRQHRARVQPPALQQRWASFMGDGPMRRGTSEASQTHPRIPVLHCKTLGWLPSPAPIPQVTLSLFFCLSWIQAFQHPQASSPQPPFCVPSPSSCPICSQYRVDSQVPA